jgi:predicted flap endonuclease-1-like 5' DNA nuclease
MIRRTWISLSTLMVLTGCAQQDETAPGLPWWGWLIIILVIFLLFWLVFRSRPEEEVKTPPPATPKVDEAPAEMPSRAVETPLETASAPLPPDDLTIIEGIGPKINAILQAAGVNTFAQLAALEPSQIMAILTAGGIRLADATTWPEQAGMAARGEMERLQLYQDTLKGGRVA